MPTEVSLAVAGSGKTAEIIDRISMQPLGMVSAALTFTRQAQAEIESRLPPRLESDHETMGWYSFLTRHIVRPYMPKIFPSIIPRGLCFVESQGQIPRYRKGWKYYFNDEYQPYSARLSVLAKKVLDKSDGAPIRRLEGIYSNLYIDEFQDLGGNDLEVLQAMMKSRLELFLTGDVRQALLETSRSDQLNREYRGVKLVGWFREQEDAKHCRLVSNDTTTRFNQQISDFSDLIHDPSLSLPRTTSAQTQVTGHDGVFLVDELDAGSYSNSRPSRPTVLWPQKSKRIVPEGELLTFGKAKGITRDRVIVLATEPIGELLKSRTLLKPRSASGFYVAVTRARYSVAIVVRDAAKVYAALHPDFSGSISLWTHEAERDPDATAWLQPTSPQRPRTPKGWR